MKTDLPRDRFGSDLEAPVGQKGVGDERHGCRPSGRRSGERAEQRRGPVALGRSGGRGGVVEFLLRARVQHSSTRRAAVERSGCGATDSIQRLASCSPSTRSTHTACVLVLLGKCPSYAQVSIPHRFEANPGSTSFASSTCSSALRATRVRQARLNAMCAKGRRVHAAPPQPLDRSAVAYRCAAWRPPGAKSLTQRSADKPVC